MKRTYGEVTALSLVWTLLAAPAFSQAPAYSPPAGPQPANPPYWYFDLPAAPLSPFAGQPGSLISRDAGLPYGYDPQFAPPVYAEPYANAAQPAAPVAFAARRYGDADYGPLAHAGGPHPCLPATKCR